MFEYYIAAPGVENMNLFSWQPFQIANTAHPDYDHIDFYANRFWSREANLSSVPKRAGRTYPSCPSASVK